MTIKRVHELVFRSADKFADATALIDFNDRRFSWNEYVSSIEAGRDLLVSHGVRTGDRVMIVAENCAALAILVFAASLIEAIAIPVNARMSPSELKRISDHAMPGLTIWTTAASPSAREHADTHQAQHIESPFGALAVKAHAANAGTNTDPADIAVLLYTTGTTGTPKGVMLSHANFMFAGAASATLRDMRPTDLIYGALPLTHVFGLASMLMASAHAGAAIQFTPRFKAEQLLAALKQDVTLLPAVPQMHALLMHHTHGLGEDRLTGSKLRYVSSGAAPLDPAWKRKAEAFYGLPLQNGYGMTESTAGVSSTCNPIGSPDTSVGKPLPGVEVKLDTSVGSATDVGEVLTRGPHVMLGYFRNDEETTKAIDADGFLHTGDLGRFDEDGNLHIVGRAKELIIRSGFNVYPPEVEAAFNDHPDVVQCAVIGRNTKDGNEEVLAFVQCADPEKLDLAGLQAFVAERLTSYKRPSFILPVKQLPAASTGKILKHKLLEEFASEIALSPA